MVDNKKKYEHEWEIFSKNIDRAYTSHIGEAAGAAADATDTSPAISVKDGIKVPTPMLTREIAKFYIVGNGESNVVVPVHGTVAVGALSSGTYPLNGDGLVTFKTITVDQDYGVNIQWNRQFAEKAQWEVMQPFIQEGIRSAEDNLMSTMVAHMVANAATENTFAIAGTLTWGNFVTGITQLHEQNMNVDKVLVGPALYGELLELQQFVDASYMGSDSNISTGIIRTQLGADVIMSNKVPSNTILFIDSSKAMGVGMRRDAKVEEYSYPDTDKYGIVTSQYYGVGLLNTFAIAKGGRP